MIEDMNDLVCNSMVMCASDCMIDAVHGLQATITGQQANSQDMRPRLATSLQSSEIATLATTPCRRDTPANGDTGRLSHRNVAYKNESSCMRESMFNVITDREGDLYGG